MPLSAARSLARGRPGPLGRWQISFNDLPQLIRNLKEVDTFRLGSGILAHDLSRGGLSSDKPILPEIRHFAFSDRF